jgi:sterol desaturase/sphingolipid hydroxylase (fatty acid hydroxylase superfamily)
MRGEGYAAGACFTPNPYGDVIKMNVAAANERETTTHHHNPKHPLRGNDKGCLPLSSTTIAFLWIACSQRYSIQLLEASLERTTSHVMNHTAIPFGPTPTIVERLLQGPDALETFDLVLLALVIMAALEFLNYASHQFGDWLHLDRIPVRGKHLDEFSLRDHLFVGFSKISLPPFVYFYLRYSFYCESVPWNPSELTVANTAVALLLLFVVYDFFYTVLHGLLHVKGIYAYVHKHHHHQKAPSRANVDAINVHPLEFFLGEYNHLWALYLTSTFLVPVHVVTAVFFLALGGFLAGLNHTRHDVVLQMGGLTVFDSKAHDVHHRIPQSNYGQYTMLWDYIFGTYR